MYIQVDMNIIRSDCF